MADMLSVVGYGLPKPVVDLLIAQYHEKDQKLTWNIHSSEEGTELILTWAPPTTNLSPERPSYLPLSRRQSPRSNEHERKRRMEIQKKEDHRRHVKYGHDNSKCHSPSYVPNSSGKATPDSLRAEFFDIFNTSSGNESTPKQGLSPEPSSGHSSSGEPLHFIGSAISTPELHRPKRLPMIIHDGSSDSSSESDSSASPEPEKELTESEISSDDRIVDEPSGRQCSYCGEYENFDLDISCCRKKGCGRKLCQNCRRHGKHERHRYL